MDERDIREASPGFQEPEKDVFFDTVKERQGLYHLSHVYNFYSCLLP